MQSIIQSVSYILITFGIGYMLYFFSVDIRNFIRLLIRRYKDTVGRKALQQEITLQRYVFLHRDSLLSKGYRWVNKIIVAMGWQTSGITPTGVTITIAFITLFTTGGLCYLLKAHTLLYIPLYVILFVCTFAGIRILVSQRLEIIEADVLDAIDLIIPDIAGGTKNAIDRYINNFRPSVQPHFIAFKINMEDRGMPFNDAIIILASTLGDVFLEFAQMTIYYEETGTAETLEMFDTLVEKNRLRRTLRDKIAKKFMDLSIATVLSTLIIVCYTIGVIMFDAFTRHFFLETDWGKFALVCIGVIIFYILGSFVTLKSRAL